jgi:glutamyl-tRNA reductase
MALLSNLAHKLWKPAAFVGATVYGTYGLYEWNKAKSELNLNGMGKKELENVFDSIDVNKKGFINVDELTEVLNKSNKIKKFSNADIKAMLAAADENHDGNLSKEEFVHICEASASTKKTMKSMQTKKISKMTNVDERHLEAEYAISSASHHKHLQQQQHRLTPTQVHDEVKTASAVRGVDK